MKTPLVLTILVLLFSNCKEPVVIPNTKTIVFNLIVPESKPIHALSFKVGFDPQIFEFKALEASGANIFAGGSLEAIRDPERKGLWSMLAGQKGVHAPISGVGEIGRITLKRLVEPSPQSAIIEGVGTAIFYESDGKRKLYSFRYKLAERLDNFADANVTLEIE